MSIVPAKCTQCGANINVDSTRDAGICEYCDTAFVTEKAISKYMNENSSVVDVDNLLALAKTALETKDGEGATAYANKVLEINYELSEAWLIKMKATYHLSTYKEPRAKDAIVYGKKAIEYSSDKENTKNEVYNYYVKMAEMLLKASINSLKDVEELQSKIDSGIYTSEEINKWDNDRWDTYSDLLASALVLKLEIDEDYVKNSNRMQDKFVELSNLYLSFCEAKIKRLKMYGYHYKSYAILELKETLQLFKKGIGTGKLIQINDDRIENCNEVSETKKEGCYIATCVYGSYDCPQVWTLRRFRDNVLNKKWYGKLFIKSYYTISPSVVKYFGKSTLFRTFFKNILDKILVKLEKKRIKNTPYQDK